MNAQAELPLALGGRLVDILGGSGAAFADAGMPSPSPSAWLSAEWQGLLQLALANGVSSHLGVWLAGQQGLADDSPAAAAKAHLNQRARVCGMRSMAMRAELLRLLKAFAAAGIRVMPLKGPVLADLYHARPQLREFGDLDLLVPEAERDRAWALLLQLGYHSPYQNHSLQQRYHVVFRHRQHDEMVELHWRIAGPQFGRYYRGDFLWAEAAERPWRAGISVCQPSAEATLLYLAIHAYKHDWERLQWLLDLPEVLASAGFDWDRLDALARSQRAHRLLRASLQLCWLLFPHCPQPPSGHALLRPALAPAQLARVRRLMLKPPLDRERAGDFLALRVANADTLRDRLRLLWHSTQASDRDVDALGAPRWLQPAARLIRPFRLMLRALGGRSRARDRSVAAPDPGENRQ